MAVPFDLGMRLTKELLLHVFYSGKIYRNMLIHTRKQELHTLLWRSLVYFCFECCCGKSPYSIDNETHCFSCLRILLVLLKHQPILITFLRTEWEWYSPWSICKLSLKYSWHFQHFKFTSFTSIFTSVSNMKPEYIYIHIYIL